MATIDRFKEAVEAGTIIDANDLEVPLSAQMKYDCLAAKVSCKIGRRTF